eukprot:TRINITY_DN13886_c0_g1_i1.p1 TRINITY_DN13886_c0_g1~~TRINITY_DN13886_c0_g1_i1.p1  ORF type:complete len:514 (-),score=129.23 TRINITY_DN13886_c0_g1_i1:39-1538(-)
MASAESAASHLLSVLKDVQARLSVLEGKAGVAPARTATAAPASPSVGSSSPIVSEYENILSGLLNELSKLGAAIGGDVQKQTEVFASALQAQRDFLQVVAASKKPSDEVLAKLIQPTADQLAAAEKAVDKRSENFNLVSALSQAANSLGWVCVDLPVPHVKEALDQMLFFGNKARMQYKETDKTRVEFIAKLKELLETLQAYVKAHHTTGCAWNRNGGDAASFKKTGGAPPPPPRTNSPAPSGGRGPPPPPTGGADDFAASLKEMDMTSGSKGGDRSEAKAQMFAELAAKSDGVSAAVGLKKVTDDMKTKNRPKDDSAPLPVPPKAPVAAKKTAAAARPRGPAIIELRGQKWHVENHVDNTNIILKDVEPRQSVYVYNCVGCAVQIPKKCNSVAIDKCNKTGVVVEEVMGSTEVVNSDRLQLQVNGICRTVQIDSSTGISIFLTKENRQETTVVTSKSAEMNICVMEDEDTLNETPIPEQFVTTFQSGKWVTLPNAHLG